jgi:hypothetical protein
MMPRRNEHLIFTCRIRKPTSSVSAFFFSVSVFFHFAFLASLGDFSSLFMHTGEMFGMAAIARSPGKRI